MSKFWNLKVRELEPYVPGEQPKDKKYIKLNTNENPYGPSPKVIETIKSFEYKDLKLYPDPEASELKKSIADYYKLKENQIFIGNGSDEVLAFSFMTFFDASKKILFPDISYSFYKVYAELFQLKYELIELDKDFNIPLEKMYKANGGIILPNPNAPTSIFINTDELKDLVEHNKNTVVIIDEAYIDFGGESMIKFIDKYENLLIIQTLSKSRSLAGMRIGIALGNKTLIEGLNRVKNSFNSYTLDRIAIASGKAAIEDKSYFNDTCNKIIKTRENTIAQLSSLGFNILPSKANFLFISHPKVTAEYLYRKLRENGILVRYFKKKRIDNYLRITIGTDDESLILINTLKNIIGGI